MYDPDKQYDKAELIALANEHGCKIEIMDGQVSLTPPRGMQFANGERYSDWSIDDDDYTPTSVYQHAAGYILDGFEPLADTSDTSHFD